MPEPAESFDPLEGSSTSPSGASIPLGDDAAPGFESIPDESEVLPQADEDGWYDVTTGGDEESGPASATTPVTSASDFAALEQAARRNGLLIGISLIVLLGGLLAFLVWRRRKKESEVLSDEQHGMSLARGVSQTIRNRMDASVADIADGNEATPTQPLEEPSTEPAADDEADDILELEADPEPEIEPEPAPAPSTKPVAEPSAPAFIPREPARLDLGLEIVSASRSVMMFSIEFRLDVANRSDHAVRDLVVTGRLACAQRNSENAAGDQPVATLDRIGPQQSGRVSGRLQLPLGEVQAIRQGAKPLFIPLLHITLEGPERPSMQASYVIGSPSAASQGRVHPLPLDGPPGGLPGLRAQLIRQPLAGDAKAAQTA